MAKLQMYFGLTIPLYQQMYRKMYTRACMSRHLLHNKRLEIAQMPVSAELVGWFIVEPHYRVPFICRKKMCNSSLYYHMAKCQEGNSEWCVVCLPFMKRGRRETGIFLYEHVFMYT